MIMKEDIKKELSNFKKLSTLEPLFDIGIEYFLWKIYDLDHEAEAYRSAFCQFSDEYYGLF